MDGIVQVYTGGGKGKTTAAWGQALRAAGQGLNVCVVQFLKCGESGEVLAARRLGGAIRVFGKTSPYDPNVDQSGCRLLAEETQANFRLAVALVESGEYDLVVLDEMNNVLQYGFVSIGDALSLLERRPRRVNLVITGRHAPAALLDAADLVTEMRELKHPYCSGAPARRGIEY